MIKCHDCYEQFLGEEGLLLYLTWKYNINMDNRFI